MYYHEVQLNPWLADKQIKSLSGLLMGLMKAMDEIFGNNLKNIQNEPNIWNKLDIWLNKTLTDKTLTNI